MKYIYTMLFLFAFFSTNDLFSDEDKSFVERLNESDKFKNSITSEPISNSNSNSNKENEFDLNEIIKKIKKRKFTTDQINYIFDEYMKNIKINKNPIDINTVLLKEIPDNIKHKIFLSRKILFDKIINYSTYAEIKDFLTKINCLTCVNKYPVVGNDYKISIKVSNIVRYNLINTYYIEPEKIKSIKSYAFLESKKEATLFGIDDNITAYCNVSYHEQRNTFIFWHCQIINVNGEKTEIKELKSKKYVVNNPCIPIKSIQGLLSSRRINIGNLDGKFGQKLFFGLIDFQAKNHITPTGKLDKDTCYKLKNIWKENKLKGKL